MKPLDTVKNSFAIRLIAATVFCVTLSALLSAAFFYYRMDRSVGDVYEDKIRMLSHYKFEIVEQSLMIFGGFAFLALLGIAASGVLQTHKVVGPLVMTRSVAKQFADGNFDAVVKFREGDAIQPIADSLNKFARIYGERYAATNNCLEEMYREAREMKELLQKGDTNGASAVRVKIVEKTKELEGMLSDIRL